MKQSKTTFNPFDELYKSVVSGSNDDKEADEEQHELGEKKTICSITGNFCEESHDGDYQCRGCGLSVDY